MKLLLLDNYDSFTYNLLHAIEKVSDAVVTVKRNDEITVEEAGRFDKILLSPGPGIPEEAGVLKDMVRAYAGRKPILGVCLGQQAIGEVFGGELENLSKVFHGVSTPAKIIKDDILFKGLPSEITIGRYHSWVVSRKNFPSDLEITALDEEGFIMALRHKTLDVRGVQFHPESVLTPLGEQIISNWVNS